MRCAGITSVIAVEWYLPQAYVEKTETSAAGYSDIPLSDQPARGAAKTATAAEAGNASAEAAAVAAAAAAEPDTTGLVVCLLLFFVHYYNFAVQETITTPFVLAAYNWDQVTVNLLFVGVGVCSLAASLAIKYLSRCCSDHALIVVSVLMGMVGSFLLVDSL